MNDKSYHALTVDDAIRALRSDDERGLPDDEVIHRRAEVGPNALPEEEQDSAILVFFRQFHSILIYILLAAVVISFVAHERKDGIAILIAIMVNVLFGFFQERRAETAIRKLKTLIVRETSVMRAGNVHRILAEDLVPGDVILLHEGDHVPADARIILQHDLSAAEASLTGESSAVRKSADPVRADAPLGDRSSMVWMGTAIVSGEGRAVVVETGTRTEFGQIAVSLQRITREKTPFELRIDRLGSQLGILAVFLAGVLFLAGTARGFATGEMFFFAVAMMVSVIPEGLPAVLAVVLAIGVQRMAKRNAVIRHIPSVETLGVCDVICTDKTGTLTENKMTVERIVTEAYVIDVTGEGWKPEGEFLVGGNVIRPTEIEEVDLLLRAAGRCTKASLEWKDGRVGIVGDPTEGGMVVLAAKAGFGKPALAKEYRQIDEIPFSSTRKYRAVLDEYVDISGHRSRHLFVVGAYDVLVARAGSVLSHGRKGAFDADIRRRFDVANADMAERVMRVLCVAHKKVPMTQDGIAEHDITDLTVLGLVGMIDPPREGVTEAIARARSAGVRVIMITGDQKATAVAIAKIVGLLDGDAKGRVYTEHEIVGLDDAAFAERMKDVAVFARVSPATKLRIVSTLQSLGHAVAMTGDGVNDAPALKKASIGISMGITGTDVSKEVADMVLVDDNFISIVNAIEEGRTVFRNITNTASFLFITNIGEVVTVLASLAVGLPLPLLPTQILWMNLVTDSFPGMALAAEPPDEGVLREKPRRRDAAILTKEVYVLTVLSAIIMSAGTIALFSWKLQTGVDLATARTVAFTTMALFQLWNVFSMRSLRESVFSLGIFSNRYVNAAIVASVGLQLAVLYIPSLSVTFNTVPLGIADWSIIVALTSSVLFAVEGYKFLLRRKWLPMFLLS